MDISFWAATDPGRVREINEDNFLVDKSLNLFVVCDGMGGHAAGEIASSAAARIVRDVLAANHDVLDRASKSATGIHRKDVLTLLEFAVRDACARIHKMAAEDSAKRGMGTTLSMLLISGRRGYVAHVGDSRVYLIRQQQPHQLTEDHSLVNELLKRGRLTEEEIADLPIKNAVTRAVGVYETVDVDTQTFDILPHDRFLICSDGLHNYFDDELPAPHLLDGDDPSELPRRCVDFANRAGGRDNITAVLVSVGEDKDDEHSKRFQLAMAVLREAELFQFLSFKELNRIMAVSLRRKMNHGEVVSGPGAEPALHIVLTGFVQARRNNRMSARIPSGRWFGLMSLLGLAADDTVYEAERATSLVSIPRHEFIELLRDEPPLAAKLLWNMMQVVGPLVQTDGLLAAGASAPRAMQAMFVEAEDDESDEIPVVPSSLLQTAGESGDDLADLTDDATLIESSSGHLPRVQTRGVQVSNPVEIARPISGPVQPQRTGRTERPMGRVKPMPGRAEAWNSPIRQNAAATPAGRQKAATSPPPEADKTHVSPAPTRPAARPQATLVSQNPTDAPPPQRASTHDRFARLRSMLANKPEPDEASEDTVTIVDSLANLERLNKKAVAAKKPDLRTTVKDENPLDAVPEEKTVRMVSPYRKNS